MTKEKQIIKDICPLYKEYGSCERCAKELPILEDDEPCYYECTARLIVENDYRKASDVAREIFEEAIKLAKEIADNSAVLAELEENPIKRIESKGEQIGALMVLEILAELKKKYTEGEG